MTEVWNKKVTDLTVKEAIKVGTLVWGVHFVAMVAARVGVKRIIRDYKFLAE